jgi:hypothetical protein
VLTVFGADSVSVCGVLISTCPASSMLGSPERAGSRAGLKARLDWRLS